MAYYSNLVAAIASTLLRLAAFIFFRWIPGHHFPPVILTLGLIYFTSFLRSFFTTSPFQNFSDEIDIITSETVIPPNEEDVEVLECAEGGVSEELVTKETVLPEDKEPGRIRSLLWGLPSSTSMFWTMTTATINFSLIMMTLDMVYRGPVFFEGHELSFSRVGHVSYDSAKLLVREPRTAQSPIYLSYRYADPPLSLSPEHDLPDTAWKHAGRIDYPADLSEQTDYTATLELTNLQPDTRYQYAFSNNQSGFFVTAPRTGEFSRRRGRKYTFLATSCIIPRFPYNPLDHPLHISGFTHLSSWIPRLGAHFMLFLGDFIYIDVPRRFGIDAESYRSEYRRVYASPDWPSVTNELPWIHVWDDHELANDWDRNITGIYPAAFDPWNSYQASVNPPPVKAEMTWFTFTQGPASFFLLDTRSYRTVENDNATDINKSMLGQDQLADFLRWLREPSSRGVKWKIVASSVPFTKNWRFGDKDTWGKYLIERQIILEAMWEVGTKQGVGVVVLSGDRHEFAATSFSPPKGSEWPASAVVHEFSASPLSMFYLPFRTYKQEDEEDICIKYIPDGNSKFGVIEIETPERSENSGLRYRLIIDGKEVWTYLLTSPPPLQMGFFDGVWS